MLENASNLLKLYDRAEEPGFFFNHVVFCTNVTYADGHFKGGTSSLIDI
jgi:folylpolyglutamate synthase